jgi:hypothetical protein
MSNIKETEELQELILIDHKLNKKEHSTILHSLKNFMGSLMSPIGAFPAAAVKSIKRQRDITADLINSLSGYNKELCVTDSELNILKKALKNFACAPVNNLKNAKTYQNTAVSLLKELEVEEEEETE